VSCESSEWWETYHDEGDIEVFVAFLNKGSIIPNHLPLVHHIEAIETGVVRPSGLEGCSGGVIETTLV